MFKHSEQFPPMQDKYTKLEKIAEGSYGVIYKGRDNATHQFVTLKKFKKHNIEEGIPQNCLREIQMLRMLEGSQEVIQYATTYVESKTSFFLLMVQLSSSTTSMSPA